MKKFRYFLKDNIRQSVDFSMTPQARGEPVPPIEKPIERDSKIVKLPVDRKWEEYSPISLVEAVSKRRSRRKVTKGPVLIKELSFLLWATQGIRGRVQSGHIFRTVPSAGCRHSFETYLAVLNVRGLEKAIYRYLPLSHELVELAKYDNIENRVTEAALGQSFAGSSAVTFIWTTIPYRMEWRYGEASHKVIAIDIGHVCQNLYLAVEAINSGTCAIAAYDQKLSDDLIGVDGEEEFTVYMSPVSKVGTG